MKIIKIYTTSTCIYCKQVKQFLDRKKVKYQVINLEDSPEKMKDLQKITSVLTVPVVTVEGDGLPRVSIGWNPSVLAGIL